MTSNTSQMAPVFTVYYNQQSISPIYFILKPQLKLQSSSLFSTSSLITGTLKIWNMAQPKVNRELANLGVNFTNIDINEGYATQSKSKCNTPLHRARENNLLPSQTINNHHGEEALTGATTTSSLLWPPKNNSTCMNLSQNSAWTTCYLHHEQNHFLDYFEQAVLDGVIIYACDVPFQYNPWEGKYTEFLANPNRDHEFLVSQKGIPSNILNSSNNVRKLNHMENSSNLKIPVIHHIQNIMPEKDMLMQIFKQGKNSIKELHKRYHLHGSS